VISAVRNTCFAILSAIESDLRETLGDLALSEGTLEILTPDIREVASQRFQHDNKDRPGIVAENDLDLIDYTDFTDLGKMVRLRRDSLASMCGKDPIALANAIESAAPARNRVCHSRPLEDEDLSRFYDLANLLLKDYEKLRWKHLTETTKELTHDPSFVFRLNIPGYWREGFETVQHNLPIPDFDETGFVGRTSEKRDLLKHIHGPHPVVSTIGEGGVGKSALVLWCIYDVLDTPKDKPYDAIIWVSLKTKVLTPAGVEEIRDSIVNVLGIFQKTTEVLGVPSSSAHDTEVLLKEIHDYMERLRILLVIDNLETVPIPELRSFLGSIPQGSKVVITSRIGLGEIELRYKLDPMDKKQSAFLMRRFAKSLNVKLISDSTEDRLDKYCRLLYFNPLLIKWFVSSVAAGSDPDRLSAKGNQAFSAAIQFCFENLFTRLSTTEQEILYILASARRQLTHAELYFLLQEVTSLEQADLESALSVLHNSSMLKRTIPDSKKRDSGTLISLTDIAADYIAQFAPPPSKVFERVKASLKKLREMTERSATREALYKYDLFSVRADSRDERISGMYLNSALEFSKTGRTEQARNMIKKAKDLLPTFAEAYRISALIESKADDLYRAAEENETAIDLDRTSAVARYQYAVFLLNMMEDSEHALIEIDAAISLDREDESLQTIRALALMRLGRYKEAADIYEQLLPQLSNRPRKWRITTRDQAAECYRRWAENDRAMRESELRHKHLDRALSILEEGFDSKDTDRRTGVLYTSIIEDGLYFALDERNQRDALALLSKLRDASYVVDCPPFRALTFERFIRGMEADEEYNAAIHEFTEHNRIKWSLEPVLEAKSAPTNTEDSLRGFVKSMIPGEHFGFITDTKGEDWFFHQNHLSDQIEWSTLREGTKVAFREGTNKTGRCAVDVHRIS
jgi:LuxR family glucitol operon transcriptional activator